MIPYDNFSVKAYIYVENLCRAPFLSSDLLRRKSKNITSFLIFGRFHEEVFLSFCLVNQIYISGAAKVSVLSRYAFFCATCMNKKS